jgi:pSer/pThr/pTyr-binding forkhead associated (FHA) protein
MKCSLVVGAGSLQGKSIPITKSTFLIGRDAKCHLRPASQTISKRHCSIQLRDGQLFVEDMGSTNGTFINDEKVESPRALVDGDKLKIGPLEFMIKLEQPAQVEKATLVDKDTETQLPAVTPKPVKKDDDPFDDDAIASMLLEGAGDTPSPLSDPESSAGSSTVMEMLTPAQMEKLTSAEPSAPYRPSTPKPASSASSSLAAKAILEKYRRRPKA